MTSPRALLTLSVRIGLALVFLVSTLQVSTLPAYSHPASAPTQAVAHDGPLALAWSSEETDQTTALAWGDVDGDGDLDLAVGNNGQPNRLYLNRNGQLSPRADWSAAEPASTTSLAWGDFDNDGDLDLAVGNRSHPNQVYLNHNGSLAGEPGWQSNQVVNTKSIAWGDMDGDGYLDLAVGNDRRQNMVYGNNAGVLSANPDWESSHSDRTRSVAWADVNGDGYLDLAVGNSIDATRIYLNHGAGLITTPAWSSPAPPPSAPPIYTSSVAWADFNGDEIPDLALGNEGNPSQVYCVSDTDPLTLTPCWTAPTDALTTSIAWGDFDSDGDPDLAAGSRGGPIILYQTERSPLSAAQVWESSETDDTTALAWGDFDNDGDLDLAVGNNGQPNRVYRNTLGVFKSTADWSSTETNWTRSIAWGDYDQNGTLDLAAGNFNDQPNDLYSNSNGILPLDATWSTPEAASTTAIAWGDVDSDGDLDLAVGNEAAPSQLYLNNGSGRFSLASEWTPIAGWVYSLAWGDVDNDGDLDLALGYDGAPNRLYCNHTTAGNVVLEPCWSATSASQTRGLAWGDVDNDGDLDLAVANEGQPNHLYRNDNGVLTSTPVWFSQEADSTTSLAWGDVDNDGDLDLATGNYRQFNRVYVNQGGVLEERAAWVSFEADATTALAWGDIDNDGDLDLVAGNENQPGRIYYNEQGWLLPHASWSSTEADQTLSIALGDLDGDGDLDLATGNQGKNRVYTNQRDGRHTAASLPVLHIQQPGLAANGFADPKIWTGPVLPIHYSLQSTTAQPVRIVAEYSLDGGGDWQTAQPTSATQTRNLLPGEHTFEWDVFASGLYGKSDNVVLRLKAIPEVTHAANSLPGPYLYGSSAAQTLPFRVRGTQVQVLQTNGSPAQNALVFRLPADQVRAAALADLSGQPYRTDPLGFLQGFGQLATGDRLLALWPARQGDGFTLYYASAPATSEGPGWQPIESLGVQTLTVSPSNPLALFDLTVSLEWDARGDSFYQEQLASDLQRASEFLYDWTNGRAALGQITIYQDRERWLDPETDVQIAASNRLRPNADMGGVVSQSTPDPDVPSRSYQPGQVRMSAVWNRYGDLTGSLGDDWPAALAHELGHYLFFQDDDYLGFNTAGLVTPLDSCPSAMADPYRADWSEFLLASEWLPGCQNTLAHQTTGRSDWETISTFYPDLAGSGPLSGPDWLPLNVTSVRWVEPATPPDAIAVPIYTLVTPAGARFLPQTGAQAYLFRGDALIDLGQPVLGRVTARGAKPGDRLCVYSPADAAIGCLESLSAGASTVVMVPAPDLQPDIRILPHPEQDIEVQITDLPANSDLSARLYLPDGSALAATEILSQDGIYTVRFITDQSIPKAYLWLKVEGQPDWEAVITYSLGGSPAKGWDHYAPSISTDGAAMLYGHNLVFSEGEFFGLHTLSKSPPIPGWATLTGSAYRLFRSDGAPALDCSTPAAPPDCAPVTIAFHYRGADVAPGEEPLLKVYFWNENAAAWVALPTYLDQSHNVAAAAARGEGIYALMTTYEIPLGGPGWVQFTYPVLESRAVEQALAPLQGKYTILYRYDSPTPQNRSGAWFVYDPAAPAWVSDITELEFSKIYWIYLTEYVPFLPIKGAAGSAAAPESLSVELPTSIQPPATYYGITDRPDGTELQTYIGSALCGAAQVIERDSLATYKIQVAAGCGPQDESIILRAGLGYIYRLPPWDNTRLQPVTLHFGDPHIIALPFIGR